MSTHLCAWSGRAFACRHIRRTNRFNTSETWSCRSPFEAKNFGRDEATFTCNIDLPAWISSITRVTIVPPACWRRVNKFSYALSQLLSLSVSSATLVQGSGSSHSIAADLIIVIKATVDHSHIVIIV